jgi:SAM-dependent methyltransferase
VAFPWQRAARVAAPFARYARAMTVPSPGGDRRARSPAVARNREPILAVLARVLPERGLVLEIASGSGEHAVFFADALPGIEWQPTDLSADALESIDAWRDSSSARARIRAAVRLDVTESTWPIEHADAIFAANMIHASPPETTPGLIRGAARTLPPGGPLILYGPFRIGGAHTAPSNEEFEGWLKSRDPRWGVRDLEQVIALGLEAGVEHEETIPMPSNNFVVVLRRR